MPEQFADTPLLYWNSILEMYFHVAPANLKLREWMVKVRIVQHVWQQQQAIQLNL